MQLFPLLLREGHLSAAGAVHPRIDLVLDAVVIRRTKEELAHRTANLLANAGLTKIIGELPQKGFHVCDQTEGLQGLVFDRAFHGSGINIDAYCFCRWREHAGHGKRMLNCRQQHHMSHIGELLSHDFLSLNYIRRYSRDGALVANRASQHDVHIMADAGMHDAACEDFFSNSSGNSASLANGIDGAQMVLMSAPSEGKIG